MRAAVLIIGCIVALVTTLFAYAGGWLTPQNLTPARFVNLLEQLSGPHVGYRRNHAKGICVTGTFTGNGQGAAFSRAAVFENITVPVIGRFALAGGLPEQADSAKTVRSLALQFMLPNGEEWRTGMNNIPVFPVKTPQEFYDQLAAGKPDPATGKPNPALMKALVDTHPDMAAAMAIIKQRPISSGFDNATYNALNTFIMVDTTGKETPVRWSLTPRQPYVAASANTSQQGKDYLFETLAAALAKQPLQWDLTATLGMPEDLPLPANKMWPDDRRHVQVGILTLTGTTPETTGACRNINFDPLVLPAGIKPSADPLLSARSAVYAVSTRRRDGESTVPPAIKETPHHD